MPTTTPTEPAAFALSTADAASLRIGNSKSLVSSLSASHSRALKALTAKYDCDLGATNLVDTLKEVAIDDFKSENYERAVKHLTVSVGR